MTDENRSGIEAALNFSREMNETHFEAIEGGTFLVTSDRQRHYDLTASLEKHAATPDRQRGRTQLHSPTSLVEYMRRHASLNDKADTNVAVYADVENLRLTAVMNHHSGTSPGWGDWRAEYDLSLSENVTRWVDLSQKFHAQSEFASFIEDNVIDLCPAPPGDGALATMARDFAGALGTTFAMPGDVLSTAHSLEVFEKSQVRSRARREDGTVDFQFTSEHQDGSGGKLNVPKLFGIAVPVFEGGDPHFLPVILQYRVRESSIVFSVKLPLFERAKREAFGQIAEHVDAGMKAAEGEGNAFGDPLDAPLYFGRDPAPLP